MYLYKINIDMRDVLEFWIQLHSHPEIEISFKYIPKILMSKECIRFIGPLCIGTEYFKHGAYSPFLPFQNAVCFIILTYLVPVLFTFFIQGVLKLKK